MVALDTVRAANAALVRNRDWPFVAVFAGATNGIGQYALEALVKTEAEAYSSGESKGLRIYIIGRNQSKAQTIISKCQAISSHGNFTFVKAANLGILQDVDTACETITGLETQLSQREGHQAQLDLLVCTQGGIYWKREGEQKCVLTGIELNLRYLVQKSPHPSSLT